MLDYLSKIKHQTDETKKNKNQSLKIFANLYNNLEQF